MNKAYSINEVNAKKPNNSRLTAVMYGLPYLDKYSHVRKNVFAKCICGNIIEIAARLIATGQVRSCGCLALEVKRANGRDISELLPLKPANSKLTPICFIQPHRTISGRSIRKIKCLCECGKETMVRVQQYCNGSTLSCGCYKISSTIARLTKYTHSIPALHNVYTSMIRRCYNKKCKEYPSYGGRGVIVCKSWKSNYQNFLDWALTHGWKRGLQLDKDKLGDGKLYSPQTCCFLTPKENAKYKRKRVPKYRYLYKGKFRGIQEIATMQGIRYGCLYQRLFKYNKQII